MNVQQIMDNAGHAICDQMKAASDAHKRGDITKDEANEVIKALGLALMAVTK